MRAPADLAARVRRRPRRSRTGARGRRRPGRGSASRRRPSTAATSPARSSSAGCWSSSRSRRRTARRSAGARSTSAARRVATAHARRGIVCGAQQLRRRRPRRGRAARRRAARRLRDRRAQDLRPRLRRHDLLGARARPRRRPRRASSGSPSWGSDDAQSGDDAIALLGLDEETVEINVTPDRGYCFSVRGVAREYAPRHRRRVPRPGARRRARRRRPTASPSGWTTPRRSAARSAATASWRASSAGSTRPAHARAGCSGAWRRPGCARSRSPSTSPTTSCSSSASRCTPSTSAKLRGADRRPPGARGGAADHPRRRRPRRSTPRTCSSPTAPAGRSAVLALAGVMGGASSEVDDATTDVLIEAAHFDPVTVARTARRHKLSSEAAKRFERGVDPDLPPRPRPSCAVRLLVEHGGGTPGRGDRRRRAAPARPPVADGRRPAARLVGVHRTPRRDGPVERLGQIGCCGRPTDGGDLVVTPPSLAART